MVDLISNYSTAVVNQALHTDDEKING